MPPGRPVALVVHDDGDVLDLLTRALEAAAVDVIAAPSAFRARANLEGRRKVDVVVAPWERARALGGELYRWALEHRPDLRNRFVFVGDDVPAELDTIVAGRCLVVPSDAIAELVRVVVAAGRRARTPPAGVPVFSLGPTLLLVDDDPLLLDAMGQWLAEAGYNVTTVGSVRAAITALDGGEFAVVVCDWRLHDGSGVAVYNWLVKHKEHLADRLVFLSEADADDSGPIAPDRPMFRKGQDSRALIETLKEITKT